MGNSILRHHYVYIVECRYSNAHGVYTWMYTYTHTPSFYLYSVQKCFDQVCFQSFLYYVKTWWFIHVVLKHWGKHCSTVHVSTVCCIFIIKFVFFRWFCYCLWLPTLASWTHTLTNKRGGHIFVFCVWCFQCNQEIKTNSVNKKQNNRVSIDYPWISIDFP